MRGTQRGEKGKRDVGLEGVRGTQRGEKGKRGGRSGRGEADTER